MGGHHLAGPGHFEALFSARFGLQLGHLALLWATEKRARGALLRLKMLVRALKVLRFFSKMRQPARTSTRQPLISRAMKVGLMAEEAPIGNDEP
jgi:hypothetical protein